MQVKQDAPPHWHRRRLPARCPETMSRPALYIADIGAPAILGVGEAAGNALLQQIKFASQGRLANLRHPFDKVLQHRRPQATCDRRRRRVSAIAISGTRRKPPSHVSRIASIAVCSGISEILAFGFGPLYSPCCSAGG
jgi:hypothetical protein